MQTSKVKSAAFAFLGPDALRIILANKGYFVSLFTGDINSLTLSSKDNNIVILPKVANRNKLLPIADKIKYLLLHASGSIKDIENLGIPILDAKKVDDELVLLDSYGPNDYVNLIETKAVDLVLIDDRANKQITKKSGNKKKKNKKRPDTYNGWLALLENILENPDLYKFVEVPVFEYFIKIADLNDLKRNLKKLITEDCDDIEKKVVKAFYKWLQTKDAQKLADACLEIYKNENSDVEKIAEEYDVFIDDLLLLYSVLVDYRNA